ncbi:zinc-ribbon domain-containing protein [bacterium]|nr:zinc-ribbon domain-containing protein [bacterium]
MAFVKCPECGKEISDKAAQCIHCGCPIEIEIKYYCKECGAEILETDKVCPNCGIDLETGVENSNISSLSDCEKNISNLSDCEKNISFFLKLAKFFKYGALALAGLILLIGIMSTGGTGEGEMLGICFIFSISLVIVAILSAPFLEWKAYVLKNLYEINTNKKNK